MQGLYLLVEVGGSRKLHLGISCSRSIFVPAQVQCSPTAVLAVSAAIAAVNAARSPPWPVLPQQSSAAQAP